MKYKILFGMDFHKRMKDLTTIRGYTKVNREIQLDLMNILKEGNFTHFISVGDWFHSGYGSDVAAALAHTDIDRQMADLLNGNFYGVIGNHIRIRLDSNPELFLIQPHDVYKSRHEVTRREQIIKTPKSLVLNGVQIHFMHWDKDAESAYDYKAMIDPNCHYHIGLYHTEYIIPNHYLHGLNMHGGSNDNSMISKALEGIDLAIVGQVHKPLGKFTINKSDGTSTVMIVPGSLTNTDAGLGSRHDYCDLPVVEIDEDGTVAISSHKLYLRTDELQFMLKSVSDEQRDKLRSLRGNAKETLYEELEQTTFVGEASGFLSLNAFMQQQGYTQTDKSLIRTTIHNPDDIDKLTEIYMKEICTDGLS